MSSARQQQSGGAPGSVPGTSSGGTSGGSGGAQNGSSSGNGVSSRTPGAEGQSARMGSSSRKRPLCNGLINPYEDKSNDFVW